ncbi:hypothetical protein, partial [Virgisporangium ochraceum]|uniref:hypothetical protein n=1 Tax=Virgisporangium ochraceum TaxID=65505 RepID=UPI0019452EF3
KGPPAPLDGASAIPGGGIVRPGRWLRYSAAMTRTVRYLRTRGRNPRTGVENGDGGSDLTPTLPPVDV